MDYDKEFPFSDEVIEQAKAMRSADDFPVDFSVTGIPKRYWGVTFDHHPNVITEALREFATTDDGILLIQGANGSGKTEAACAMFTYRASLGLFAGLYLNAKYQICPMIRSCRSYSSKQNEMTVMHRYYSAPFLVIDEVGKGDTADYERQFLSQVISARYDNLLPTVLISNFTTRELGDFLGEDIRSRFFETALIKTLNEKDWRQEKRRVQ